MIIDINCYRRPGYSEFAELVCEQLAPVIEYLKAKLRDAVIMGVVQMPAPPTDQDDSLTYGVNFCDSENARTNDQLEAAASIVTDVLLRNATTKAEAGELARTIIDWALNDAECFWEGEREGDLTDDT